MQIGVFFPGKEHAPLEEMADRLERVEGYGRIPDEKTLEHLASPAGG